MRFIVMFVTAVCVLLLIQLGLPQNYYGYEMQGLVTLFIHVKTIVHTVCS